MFKISKNIKEKLLYLFFGVLTTLVNFSSYYILVKILNTHYLIGNGLAWGFSVCFAYITNRKYVFAVAKKSKQETFQEIISFFGFRVISGLIDMLLMFILVTMLSVNDTISKIAVNVLIVVLNYLFSKFIIFKCPDSSFKD